MPPHRSTDPPANPQNSGHRANSHLVPDYLSRLLPARHRHFTAPYPLSGTTVSQLETPTVLNVPYIQYHQVPPAPMYVAQPNIAQPAQININPTVPRPNVNNALAPKFLPHPTSALDVNIRRPKYEGGSFPYRRRVTARFALTGTALRQFNQVVLGPTTLTESQLALWCYAECRFCKSSPHPHCSPIGWYLDPVHDRKHHLDFRLSPLSGTLTGNVTFNIQHRPRQPKEQDQTCRCDSESLMLTFSLYDYMGHVVVEKQVGPFRARTHTKKVRQDEPPQQYADAPHHLGSSGVPLAVPSFPIGAQTSSYMLPVGYSAPAYAPAYMHDPHLPFL